MAQAKAPAKLSTRCSSLVAYRSELSSQSVSVPHSRTLSLQGVWFTRIHVQCSVRRGVILFTFIADRAAV